MAGECVQDGTQHDDDDDGEKVDVGDDSLKLHFSNSKNFVVFFFFFFNARLVLVSHNYF